ncbi:Myb-like domain [Arabidopsis thaliana x Arabidopsis arenosa]|uniref:Myb-like domain n=1 Tax=Arabidopsis thaliana x Arabidopsis arenosa TaxID=1240361 RepID=A0A8T2AVY2_9BRAS|nr:Myb-like domain [Arabidopsis thaliana x Arabidopsis arenosa]
MDDSGLPSGFMNLLHSQQEVPGSSEVPLYSTQWSDEGSEDEAIATATPKVGVSRKKWKPKEDLVLISAWLNTSKDPIVGNDQKGGSFWKRIAAYVSNSPQLEGFPKRESAQCKQRWGKVNEIVNKFVGCYAAATNQKASGQSEDDVMKMAHQLYFNDMQKKFSLDHAWRELRFDQKWCGAPTIESSKRRKGVNGAAHPTSFQPMSVDDGERMRRPPGVKAAKAQGKKTATVKVEQEQVLNTFQVFMIHVFNSMIKCLG